jgi:hypothetical protein
MSNAAVQIAQFGGPRPRSPEKQPPRDCEELWFSLERTGWTSLVLVPAGPEAPAARYATALAEVGGGLSDSPVTAVLAESLDYEAVRMLTDLQLHVTDRRDPGDATEKQRAIVPVVARRELDREGRAPHLDVATIPPAGRVIVAIPPVVETPLGIAIAHAADAVVLCIRVGRSTIATTRRTIELIGPERVTGAFLIR